jgi:hypothetical protein
MEGVKESLMKKKILTIIFTGILTMAFKVAEAAIKDWVNKKY